MRILNVVSLTIRLYNMHELCSDILFARPTFWRGFCRAGDLFGQFDVYNHCQSPIDADYMALAADWYMLERDLISARKEFETEMENEDVSLALT